MSLFRAAAAISAVATCAVVLTGAVRAADNTRYISTSGKNANPCTLAQPCRTLQKAIVATPEGGDIQILDSGFYGNKATIRKSLTISGNGHTINLDVPLTIDKAEAVVALRNLVIDGQGSAGRGVDIANATSVHIERCVFHSFTGGDGIFANATGAKIFISHSVSRNNTLGLNIGSASHLAIDSSFFQGNSSDGARILFSSATIRGSTASGNGGNGFLFTSSNVGVFSTVVSQNALFGFQAFSGGAATIDSSLAQGNLIGVDIFASSSARISNSTFIENGTGIRTGGNTVETRGNNTVRGNTTNVNGTLTAIGGV